MEQQRIERKSGGLQCDSPSCDWTDPTIQVEDYKSWLNAPCPKCGENVLTQEDLNSVLNVIQMVDLINKLPEDGFEEFMKWSKSIGGTQISKEEFYKKHDIPKGTERLSIKFDVHKGVHIRDVKPVDNE
jgi:hypothetical protein